MKIYIYQAPPLGTSYLDDGYDAGYDSHDVGYIAAVADDVTTTATTDTVATTVFNRPSC